MTRAQLTAVQDRDAHRKHNSEVRSCSSWYLCLAVLIGVLLLFALVRFRLKDMPLERDEGEYAYVAQVLLQGLPPYQFVYSVKLPGIYAAYAAIVYVFGQSAAGIHLGLLLVNAATTILLFLVGKRVFGGLAALVAACSYALLSVGANVNGVAAHASHFVVLFAIAGMWMLFEALETGKSVLLFCAGMLFGLAFLMKQPGAVFTAWAVVYLVRRRWRRPMFWGALIGQLAALLIGAALPFAITCLLMLATGEFHNFWFWTFSYVRDYATAVPVKDGILLLSMFGSRIVQSTPGIWLIALIGLSAFAWNACARKGSFLTTSLLLFSFAGTSAGLYFRPHYFILMLPAISLLAGIAISSATEKLATRGTILRAVPVLLFVVAFGSSLYLQRQVLFQMDPAEASREIYPHNPFVEAVEVSKYIQAHTRAGDTVAVLGSEPEIFFYSQRRSATGYIYVYPLLEPRDSALPMQKQMMQEIESSHPAMLVLMNVPASWIAYRNIGSMEGILTWARKYIAENFVQDGVVEIGETTNYVWGEPARSYQPETRLSIILFRRK